MNTSSRWNILILTALLLGSGWMLFSRFTTADPSRAGRAAPREGFPAPDFTLDLLDGGQVTLYDLHGQVVVINLWAAWCPPCRAEMPAFENVFQAYEDQGVVILGVNATIQDDEQAAADFVREFGLSFLIPLDRDGAVSELYALSGLPTTFFVDQAGIIRSIMVGGPLSEATIQSKIEELLRDAP